MASVTGSRGRRAALALWSAFSPEAGSAQTCHEDVAGDDSANGRCGRSQFSEGIFSADDLCKQRWRLEPIRQWHGVQPACVLHLEGSGKRALRPQVWECPRVSVSWPKSAVVPGHHALVL